MPNNLFFYNLVRKELYMTSTVLEKETECVDDSCTVELTREDLVMEKAILLFDKAVEGSEHLEITGTAKDETVFVVRNHTLAEGIEGAYVEVSIKEIIDIVTDYDGAMQFINTILGIRGTIVCQGVTRIVGYYSRVNNWNKSKVGELRDRNQQNYALGGANPIFDADRHDAIDKL